MILFHLRSERKQWWGKIKWRNKWIIWIVMINIGKWFRWWVNVIIIDLFCVRYTFVFRNVLRMFIVFFFFSNPNWSYFSCTGYCIFFFGSFFRNWGRVFKVWSVAKSSSWKISWIFGKLDNFKNIFLSFWKICRVNG